jgi:CHAT domain-containing protein/tetratricopeptide (TPR) repeat protein
MSAGASAAVDLETMVAQLSALAGEEARRRFVAEHRRLWTPSIAQELAGRVRQMVRVDTSSALRLADAAMDISELLGDKLALAHSLRAKANALYAVDQHAAAVELHQRAIALFQELDNRVELGRTLSGSIQPFLLLGQYEQALAAAERARAIFAEQGDTLRLARLDINTGNIYHRQDRFAEACDCYERAYRELLNHDDAEGLAAALSNLSTCYISLNEFAKALETHRLARAHCLQKNMPVLVAQADYNIAYLYFLRGEYGRAIQMLHEAMASGEKAEDKYQLALCNLDLAEIYLELNLNQEAGSLARAAHQQFRELAMGYEAAKTLVFAGIAAGRQGQAFEALELFAQAKQLFTQEKNRVWPSLLELYQSLVLLQEGRLFEARQLAGQARQFFAASELRGKAAMAELLLARIALRMKELGPARQHCLDAMERLKALESPLLSYQAGFLLGEVERARADDAAAFAAYESARQALDKIRGQLRGEELKLAFFSNKTEIYEQLVDICLRTRGNFEEMFAYIEQAKSRSLLDLMAQPARLATSDDSGQSELVRSIRGLREELNWYYRLIEREQLQPESHSRERIAKLEREAQDREADLMRALQEATVAEANQAGFAIPALASLPEIRASLGEDAALVEFFFVQDRVLACVVTREQADFAAITLQGRIRKLLQLLRFQLSKFRLDARYVAKFQDAIFESIQAHLQDLYRELVAPLRPLLTKKHLVIVPHGQLHHVPFHALYDGRSYLIDQFSISYAPSASVYAVCKSKPANHDGSALVMGIPDELAPSIGEEARAVSALLTNARLLLGAEADEQALRALGPSCRSLHIATHGSFRQDNPMFSSIRLGTSYLSVYDIYQLRLPAEIVVLSGCATGLNVVSPGDELIGLARGFLQAGAQSLLLSLWDVHDASTRDFMVAFYRHLGQGNSPAGALREAMLELRAACPHPYYWAPFLLIGKD